jgi:hypothetical protein
MSALGRTQQKLRDVQGLLAGMSWSPDGKWLAVARGHPPEGGNDSPAGIYRPRVPESYSRFRLPRPEGDGQ